MVIAVVDPDGRRVAADGATVTAIISPHATSDWPPTRAAVASAFSRLPIRFGLVARAICR
jgi:hypothetical protein